jgi:PKD domain
MGCNASPTTAEGVVSITQTTTTTTTTTTIIPQLSTGTVSASPTGTGLAFATVFQFMSSPAGGVPPYVLEWNFGDGGQGAGSSPAHVYNSPGSFTATFTLADSRGIEVRSSVPVTVDTVSGTWIVEFEGTTKSQSIDLVQNQTAVVAAINDVANGLGLGSGTGSVANPRSLSVSLTFTAGEKPFAVTFVGRLDSTLKIWTGSVNGYPGCPCDFTAIKD